MTKLERKLKGSLHRLGTGNDDPLIIGVSGGADSIALLDAMVRKRAADKSSRIIVAAHINHKLRGKESDEDESFVRLLATRYDVEFAATQSMVSDIAKVEKRNLEETARNVRYDYFKKLAQERGIHYVLTAHTLDDQIETILMRLIRGTGPTGIQGIYELRDMPPGSLAGNLVGNPDDVSQVENVNLIRPILNTTRDEVIEHCQHYNVTYRTDSSNLSSNYTRNRIRHELAPLLKSFNPRFGEAFIRNAEMQKEDNEYINQISTILFSDATNQSALDISEISQAHPSLRRRAIRDWLLNKKIRFDASHLFAIDYSITHNNSGKLIELPGGNLIRRQFDSLIHLPINKDTNHFSSPESVLLSENNYSQFGKFRFRLQRKVSQENIEIMRQSNEAHEASIVKLRDSDDLDNLVIRRRRKGDGYVPEGCESRKKLKTLMIRHRIGITERDEWPVITTMDDRVVFVPGLPPAKEFLAGEEQELAIIHILF